MESLPVPRTTRRQPTSPRRRPRRRGTRLAVIAVLAALALGACQSDEPAEVTDASAAEETPAVETSPEPSPTQDVAAPSATPEATSPDPTESEPEIELAQAEPAVAAAPGTALATVAELEIKGRAPDTGYDRDLFQYRSYDLDRNGCDVRNDILRRDLDDLVIKPDTQGCVVLSGTLTSPYSGDTIDFVRDSTGGSIEIDHVVSLSDAWQKGAQEWDEYTLRTFGNDPLNLLAVEGRLNAQKGAGDTATWLPPHKPYRCEFTARQVAVKHTYGLSVTQAEHDAMIRILSDCPDQPLPEAEYAELAPELAAAPTSAAPTAEPATTPAASSPAATAPAPIMAPAPVADTDPRHDTCKSAKAAGLGPYVQGADPEYDWYRDADKDGIVCE